MSNRPKKQKPSPTFIALILLSFCCTVLLNYAYEKPLYLLGVNLIKNMQANGNIVFDYFFLFITMLIDPSIVVLGVLTLLFVSKNKKKAYMMTNFIILNTLFAATLKAYHIDPRPIWTDSQVKNIGFYCPVQYGNPSGHSWFSAILGFGLLLEYFGNGKKYQNIFISIIFCVLVPLSRMYLGAHSLDQVLYGLAMGLQVCILFSLKLKDTIQQFLFNVRKSQEWKGIIFLSHLITILPFVINLKNQLPDEWILNIYLKCDKNVNQDKLNFLMLAVNCMLINVAHGMGYNYHKLVESKHGRYYLSGNWRINRQKYGRYIGYILYIALQFALISSGFGLGFILTRLSNNKIAWYLSLGFGAFISGYIYTEYTLHFIVKYQMIQEGIRKHPEVKAN